MNEIKQLVKQVKDSNVELPLTEVKKDSIYSIPAYLKSLGFNRIVLTADSNTMEAAGSELAAVLQQEAIEANVVLLPANKHGQVLADEETIIEVMVGTTEETDAILAVGTGTIHDIVRFVSCKMNKPFISVPTAASVDGFTSKGAPLILKGIKKTIQTTAPIAVFADIRILMKAPKELNAAGTGDILGKYTSLLDWKISSLIGGEPYHPLAAELTRQSLEKCMANLEQIGKGEEKGLTVLIHSLLESGLVMQVLNHSRPASGGEHHLSHHWEINLLKRDAKQLLHGAKVGVAAVIVTDMYKRWAQQWSIDTIPGNSPYKQQLNEHWPEIKAAIEELPEPDQLQNFLKTAGGPASVEELGLPDSFIQASLNEAYQLRNRCTGLFLINKLKRSPLVYHSSDGSI
ncbi:sn-glycerol-1-phosphate dehydrogenase [Sediminibacillus albus]|uniref:Glycerol-1-phosphate dehydrogenase [NAD(P)+] n=1 Tax=Sediminibacillus albus TaxID=407036 RepID=A0A1G8ZYQ4_9BACI|nr:sn-glycerol-1-phosphate dehydrogenase [Sediminibacillus albus]SDK19260.1 glycerol-1-phosphate dehydrogenase [NAD(P)+] [Sediminibacillus albus]